MSYLQPIITPLLLVSTILSATSPLFAKQQSIIGKWKLGEHHRIEITDSTFTSIQDGDTTMTPYKRLDKNTIKLPFSEQEELTLKKTQNTLILSSKEGDIILVDEKYNFQNRTSQECMQDLTGSWVVTEVTTKGDSSDLFTRKISHIRFHENSSIELFYDGYSQGNESYLIADNYLLTGYDAERSIQLIQQNSKKITLLEPGSQTTIQLRKEDFISNDLIEENSGYFSSTMMMHDPNTPRKSKKEYMLESLTALKKQRKRRLPKSLAPLQGIWVYDPMFPSKQEDWMIHITPYELITFSEKHIDSTAYDILAGDTLFTEEAVMSQKMHFSLEENRLTLKEDLRIIPLIRKGTKPETTQKTEQTQAYLEGSWIVSKVSVGEDTTIYPLTEGDTAMYTFDIDFEYTVNGISKGTYDFYIHNNYLWIANKSPQKIVQINRDSMELHSMMSEFIFSLRRRKPE